MCSEKSKVHVDLVHEATMLVCVYDEKEKRLICEEQQRKAVPLGEAGGENKRSSKDGEGTSVPAGLSVLKRPSCITRSET